MSQPGAASQSRQGGRTQSRSPISRPTTPLRASSRSSFRTSQSNAFAGPSPLDDLEPQFAELSDSVADLEANLMHLQLMHESLSRFGESFASFLYGLNMNAFVVDFPEAPISESIKRYQKRQGQGNMEETTILQNNSGEGRTGDPDATFMTADASFTSIKATPRPMQAVAEEMQEEQAEVLVAQDEPVVYRGAEEEESDRENV
ncbi:DASH complex subunit dam1 [Exophiala xenobiotica]|uniref:DASH complex subunit DAM1 n=1 Tax=Vermiconidia calcicola TaxID=1690605 RepID=A0AAV9Q1Y3_9PEZI|nr:DASH complex subunit dam1 [Exophiala xenobiotica]KAK5296467.1 DASH complex subunit dam1 [Exophiala xenobiotica]KAK5533478.1 DASH complex subunit dam1 [Vermiconidia calcicola]KAK5542939.1 DASH complex subunit dam1 [Chaetothyriales sp. CCFEE 6169]